MYINDKNSRLAGIEPATPRLEVWCATNCATNAFNCSFFLFYIIFLLNKNLNMERYFYIEKL